MFNLDDLSIDMVQLCILYLWSNYVYFIYGQYMYIYLWSIYVYFIYGPSMYTSYMVHIMYTTYMVHI